MAKVQQVRKSSEPIILSAGVQLAISKGLNKFSREEVASRAEVSAATVSFHFGTMDDLRKRIVQYAVAHQTIPILVDVIVDRSARKMGVRISPMLKKKIAAYITR